MLKLDLGWDRLVLPTKHEVKHEVVHVHRVEGNPPLALAAAGLAVSLVALAVGWWLGRGSRPPPPEVKLSFNKTTALRVGHKEVDELEEAAEAVQF